MEEAEGFWRDHAYLEVDPQIRTRVGYDASPKQRSQYLTLMETESLDHAPDDPDVWEAQQAELDLLTDYALGRALSPELAEADNPYRDWGLIPADIALTTLVTYMFMHAGWLHLLSNLFMLFLAGPPVEDRLGRPLFAAFYLGAGIFAALFWAMFVHDKNIPLVGASGAIAGVLGAFFIRFWSSDIRFAYFFLLGFRPIFGTFSAKAWLILPLWLLNELFQGWLAHSLGASDGVAYWAHAGGFLFGAGMVLAIRIAGIEEKFIDKAIESKVTVAGANPIVEQALALREQGDHSGALAMLQEAWRADRADPDIALSLWDTAQAVDQPEAGAEAMAALVRLSLADGNAPLAIRHWMDLTRILPTALVDPGSLVRLVPVLQADGDTELAERALRHSVDPNNTRVSPGIALRVVELTRESDPPTALRAARRALESADLHETKRARIEGIVRELETAGVSEAPDAIQEEEARRAEAEKREIEVPDSWDTEDAAIPMAAAAAVAARAAPPPLPPELPPPLPRATPPPLPAPSSAPSALSIDGERVHDAPARGVLEGLPQPVAAPVPPPLPGVPPNEPMYDVDDPLASIGLEAVSEAPRFGGTKVVDAVPTALQDDVLRMMIPGGRKAKLEYEKIEAVSVAAVRGLGPKPVLLIDLLLNWTALEDVPLRVIRLRSDAFDPRSLVPDAGDAKGALRRAVETLLERSGAVALPSASAARGEPFDVFGDLETYERQVLQVAI
jgi:membrane associated rhomboid family serine protease